MLMNKVEFCQKIVLGLICTSLQNVFILLNRSYHSGHIRKHFFYFVGTNNGGTFVSIGACNLFIF